MAGIKAFQRINIGTESTAGTAVAASTAWRGVGAMPEDARTLEFVPELNAIGVPTDRTYTPKIESAWSMADTPATFEQIGYILSAGLEDYTGVQDGAGTDYIYIYDVGTTSVNTIQTYTIEAGDDQQAEEMNYCFCSDFTLTGNAGEAIMMSSNWFGRELAPTTFTAVTIPVVEEILAGKGTVYIDPVGAIGSTAVSDTLLGFDLSVTTGHLPKYFIDGDRIDYNYVYFDIDSFDVTLTLTYEHNATGVAEKAAWRAETPRELRMLFDGSTVGTPGTTYSDKTLIIDVYGKYESFSALEDQSGNDIYTAVLKGKYNLTSATSPLSITVVNELSALP